MSTAFVFPGQGSQSVGMMDSLKSVSPVIESTFQEASRVLGYDLWALCQSGPEERLNATEYIQPAMLAADVATYRLWLERGGSVPSSMAGHSLGEFAALVAAGALAYPDAVALVKFRGEAMRDAVPDKGGAMAAVLGLQEADVEAACAEAAQGEVVEPANFNSPGQIVIAGQVAAVERAIAQCKARGAKRAVILPISVPCHSSLMKVAADRFEQRIATVDIQRTAPVAVYGVDIRVHSTPEAIRAALVKQIYTPVYWASTVRTLIANGVDRIIECGPGKVLTGLNRRIERAREITMISLDTPASFDQALSGH